MRVSQGKPVDQAAFKDDARVKVNREELRFAEDVDKNVFEQLLAEPVRALSRLLADDLVKLARSDLKEARDGALEAYKDPAAPGVHIDLMRPLCDALGQQAKGENSPGLVRDAGNLLRLIGAAYEKATQLIEKKFEGAIAARSGILAGIEEALDKGEGSAAVSVRLAELFPSLRGPAREMLVRIARFGQVQGAYRNGFASKVLDLAGVEKEWWALEAFNASTNRRRALRAKPRKSERVDVFSLPRVPEGLDLQAAVRWFGTEREKLIESGGRFRWVVLPTGVMFWISRLFGLSEGGDISGTTADAIFALEALLAFPEGDAVKRAFGANLPMAYLLPMVHMLKEQHHSLLEIGYALTLNDICDYVINDYATLLPKGIDRRGEVGRAFLKAAEDHRLDLRLFFDGTNAPEILAKMRALYPLSLAEDRLEGDAEQRARDTEAQALGDVTLALGTKGEIWTMESVDEIAAYRQLATCGKSQYRMFAGLRDRKSASLAEVVAAALGNNRGAALNRLCQVRAALP